ncbi:MAG: chromate efflux transporter [Pseudomonadota bacterium]
MSDATTTANGNAASAPTLAEAIRIWAKVGILSFGGPTAQIALMHKVIVEENKWLSEQQFLNALGFCMLLPGPEAMQLATYSGWRLHGVLGGLAAGLLFVLPGAAVILALATLYAYLGNVPFVNALFLGIKAAVLVIVIEALVRVSRKALQSGEHWIIAALAFVGLFFLDLPFPLIVIAAALFGFFRGREAKDDMSEALSHGQPLLQTLRTVAVWLAIWWLPLLAIAAIASDTVLPQIGLFFSKLAVVTFGGAYAVLAYMAQDVVNQFGWLSAGEMMDGLGLAETTPGPLILVTEFVGFLAAFREGGFALGLAGALVTLWVTFAPCFLWIFAGAPYIDWIGAQPRLKGALAAITAAVVGVILNLSAWFALHVFFAEVSAKKYGFLTVWTPYITTLDWRVIALAALSAFLLFARHWPLWQMLLTASLAGAALSYAIS